jgi:hypothetical protein
MPWLPGAGTIYRWLNCSIQLIPYLDTKEQSLLMSDHLRISSPISSSPGRPIAIARPAWPWQTPPLRSSPSSSSSLDYRPSLNHPSRSISSSSVAHASSASVSWHSTPRQRPSSTMGNASNSQEETTRQWTFMVRRVTLAPPFHLTRFQGFEWSVRDVHKLRNCVEGEDSTEEESSDFEILKQSPVLGDNKFKLEIGQFYSNLRSFTHLNFFSLCTT